MSTSSLVVKPRVKSFLMALLAIFFGIVLVSIGPSMVGAECSGGRLLFCEMMSDLPRWLQLSVWVGFGLLMIYLGMYTLVRVFRGAVMLSLNDAGIAFNLGGDVLVPWDDVVSVSVSPRILTVKGRTPRRIRYVFGRRKETDKFFIPLVFGRAYVDGKFTFGSASSAVKTWLGEHGIKYRGEFLDPGESLSNALRAQFTASGISSRMKGPNLALPRMRQDLESEEMRRERESRDGSPDHRDGEVR